MDNGLAHLLPQLSREAAPVCDTASMSAQVPGEFIVAILSDHFRLIAGLPGRGEDALSTARLCVTLAPEDPAALSLVVQALQKLGRDGEELALALRQFGDALQKEVEPAKATAKPAKATAKPVKAAAKLEDFEFSEDVDAAAEGWFCIAKMRLQGRDYAGAAEWFEKAARLAREIGDVELERLSVQYRKRAVAKANKAPQ
jgi:tetratricopeptide (TPR) repeat protein